MMSVKAVFSPERLDNIVQVIIAPYRNGRSLLFDEIQLIVLEKRGIPILKDIFCLLWIEINEFGPLLGSLWNHNGSVQFWSR
jgi:hypothetical protein